MKLLFDQNISHRIIPFLPERFAGSTSVKDESLVNFSDIQIWKFAKENKFIIVTQDADFNELLTLNGFPPKVIWLRTGNQRTNELLSILISYSAELESFEKDNSLGCFQIARRSI